MKYMFYFEENNMKKVITIVVFSLLATFLNAQWSQPMHDCFVPTSVVRVDDGLIASTWFGGLFHSKDNGFTWKNFYSVPVLNQVNFLYEAGQNIIASIHPNSIYLSADQGKTWIPSMQDMTTEVKCFTGTGSTIYAGLRDGTIFKSGDYGKTWKKTSRSIVNLSSIALFSNCLVVGSLDGLFFLDTVSFNHSFGYNNPNAKKVTSIVTDGKIIAIGTEEMGVYLTYDSTKTWSQSLKGLDDYFILDMTIKDDAIYAVNLIGVYNTTNQGKDWSCITLDYPVIDIKTISFSDEKLFMFTEENGLLLSKGGAKAVIVSSGLKYSSINSIFNEGNLTYAGVIAGVFKSEDMGDNWSSATKWNLNKNVLEMTSNAGKLFAATGLDGVIMSEDSGKTWKQSFDNTEDTYVNSVISSNGKVFAGTTNQGIYRCTDNNTDWQQVNTGLTNTGILCLAQDKASLYAGTDEGGVYVTHNGGDLWEELSPVIKFQKITSLALSGDTVAAVAGSGIVMLSFDKGKSWKEDNDVLDGDINCIKVFDNKIIAGTTKGVLIYNDFYDKWQPQNKGLNHLNVLCLESAGNTVFAGTDNGGVYVSAIENIQTGVVENMSISNYFTLYPQPATDYLFIEFPGSYDDAEITITNELGIVLQRELLSGNKVNIENLSQGVYYISVISGKSRDTGKFIVVR